MSFELADDVAPAKSSASAKSTLKPRAEASAAMPVPLMPPPTTTRS